MLLISSSLSETRVFQLKVDVKYLSVELFPLVCKIRHLILYWNQSFNVNSHFAYFICKRDTFIIIVYIELRVLMHQALRFTNARSIERF